MADLVRMSPLTLSKGRLWTSLVVILFGQFVVSIDLTVLNMALPDLTQDLRPTSDQLLWIVDVYSLVLAGLLVATSALSDRFGRKTALLAGFFLFGAGSALVMLAESPEHVIAIRAFLGAGGALIMPVTISMVRSIFTDAKERAMAVAAWSAVSALGMAVGPLVGGFLLEHFNWHAAFFINVPFMSIALLIGFFVLPEVKLENPGRFDLFASLIFLAGMVALLWGIKHVAAELAFDTPGIAALLFGVVLLAFFVFRCLKSKTPLVDLSLFRSRTFTAGIIATAGSTFAMAVLLYLLSQWLQLVNGDGSFEAGMKLVPMAVASLVASAGASMLALRFQARNVIASGMVVAAGAMIMLLFFQDDLTIEPVMMSTTLVGVGTGALAIGASLIMCETPVEKASSAGSLQEISYDMGNVLGVAILGSFASIVYREGLNTGTLRALGLDNQTIRYCEQSFSVAAELANETGITEIFDQGVKAFNESVVLTCLVGGVIILVIAAIVWWLIPRDVKITQNAEDRQEEAFDGQPAKADESGDADENAEASEDAPASDNEPHASEPTSTAPQAAKATSMPNESADGTSERSKAAPNEAPSSPTATPFTAFVTERAAVDETTLQRMEATCREMGITAEIAFGMFAHKVVNERRIPFSLEIAPSNSQPADNGPTE